MSGREPRVETATCGGGWRATSAATPIVNRERIRALELSTNAPTTPEMLFDSALELTHESGVTLRFHAEDALREWVALDLPAVKVAAAETWTRAHVERFGDRDARGNDESTATGTSEPSTLTAAPASSSWTNAREPLWIPSRVDACARAAPTRIGSDSRRWGTNANARTSIKPSTRCAISV